ncbi:MAG: glycoside hydrolase family 16 protein, partial [Prevotellaceae bacterium]|nr:glycoside hydrolase family 16 protein [Prevotellaceae bacterium]
MKLLYADDFDEDLSISNDGKNAKYNATPLRGNFSGWPFVKPDHADGSPFSQVDSYLRITAKKKEGADKGTTGFIASARADGGGFWVTPPCYLECRFTAQSAVGTWPAFWAMTYTAGPPGDELD